MRRVSNALPLLKQFFLTPTALQPKLQLLFLLMQQVFYITLINGITFRKALLFNGNVDIYLMLGLLTACMVKLFLKISLTSAFGLIVLQIILKSSGIFQIINNFLLVILFLADLLDSIAFDISSLNVQSQVRNGNKVAHFVLLKGSIIILCLTQTHAFLQIFFFGAFLLIFLRKDKTLLKRQDYGKMYARFYMWAAFEHVRLFLGSFFQVESSIWLITSLVTSQILYQLYVFFTPEINFQEMLAKQEYVRLCFLILKYHFFSSYDEKKEKMINTIANDDEICSNVHGSQGLFQIIIRLLSKDTNFESLILVIELNIANGHLITAMNVFTKARQQLRWYHFFSHIILCKLQYALLDRFLHKSHRMTMIYEEQWRSYLTFQHLLNKSARQNLKLNNYLKSNIIELKIIKKIGYKINLYQDQMHCLYEKIKKSFIASTQYYFNYLMKIKNDYQAAKDILTTYFLTQKSLVDCQISSKMYLKLKVDDQSIKIEKVGFNSMELLHYSQKELEGQCLQRMLPHFFRTQHQKLSYSFICTQFEEACLFQKRTFVLDSKGKYQQCNLVFKLNYYLNEGFFFQGHLHIIEDQRYNLKHFFFVNQNGKILESDYGIFNEFQYIHHNIDQFFSNPTIGKPIEHVVELDTITYDPIITIRNGSQLVYFYTRRSQNRRLRSKKGITCKQLQQASHCHQEKVQKRSHSSQIHHLQKQIKNLQIFILIVLLFLFIFVLFVCQYLLFFSSQVKYNNQYSVVTNGEALMQYYDNLYILAIDLTYQDLNINFQYNNSFTEMDSVSGSLSLSHFNEKLKQYNRGKYAIPSTNSLITYQQSNYQIVQLLISNAYAYQKLKTDSFVRQNILQSFQSIMFTLFMNSFIDYRISVLSLVAGFVEKDNFYNRIAFISNLVVIIIILLLVVKLFAKLRNTQRIALTYICSTINQTKIKQILYFLHELNLEEITMDINKQIIDINVIAPAETDSPFAKTETSFIQQMSNRDLIQDTLTKSNIQFDQTQMNSDKITRINSKHQFQDTKSYSILIIVCLFLALLLIGLVLSNQIINNQLRDINQSASINSIIILYRASAFYSRAIIITLNSILLKQARNIDNSLKYNPAINSYYTYLTQFTIPTFPQTAFPEFSEYTQGYNQLYQLPICEYLSCDPQFKEEMNLYFMTVISKFSTNLSSLANVTSKMNSSEFKNFIASPAINEYIDALFMSESLLRNYTIGLSMTYLRNYEVFMKDLFDSKMNFIIVILTFTIAGLILLLYMTKFIRNQQQMLIKVINIYY